MSQRHGLCLGRRFVPYDILWNLVPVIGRRTTRLTDRKMLLIVKIVLV